jgi:hypothetical protein
VSIFLKQLNIAGPIKDALTELDWWGQKLQLRHGAVLMLYLPALTYPHSSALIHTSSLA